MTHTTRRGWTATALGVAVLAGLLSTAAAAADTFKPFKLKTPEGVQTPLADVLGKATLVAFFYPTCPYCNAAFPEIQKLYDTYKPQGLSMVWINVVPDEDRLVRDWMTKHSYTVPVLLGGRSAQGDYKLTITPTHYLLDPKGKVLWKHAGYTAGDEKNIDQEIRKALAAAP